VLFGLHVVTSAPEHLRVLQSLLLGSLLGDVSRMLFRPHFGATFTTGSFATAKLIASAGVARALAGEIEGWRAGGAAEGEFRNKGERWKGASLRCVCLSQGSVMPRRAC
jgi:hypothetical protein